MGAFLGYSLCISVAICIIQRSIGAAQRDYYKVLSLHREATEVEIKEMFRKLALKYHPDKNHSPDAELRFLEIQRAFEVLSDPIRRGMHDIKLGMGERYNLGNGRGALPSLVDLQTVSDTNLDSRSSFDSGDVVTGYYVTVDHVTGFEPPPDKILHPRASVRRLQEKPEWSEDDGSITCTTFSVESGDNVSHAKHTRCR